MKIKNLGKINLCVALLFTIVLSGVGIYLGERVVCCHCYRSKSLAKDQSEASSRLWQPTLSWNHVNLAVAYEFELLTDIKSLSPGIASAQAIFTTKSVYTNAYNINLEPYKNQEKLYWRTRALNIDKKPISDFTDPVAINMADKLTGRNYPEITARLGEGQGGTLLYPVYAWVPMWGAAKYEVEVLNREPENPQGIRPSRYRIWHKETTLSDLYDDEPRMGERTFYWRVRALDEKGELLGTYSPAISFQTSIKEKWEIGVMGDSISHGGGDMSYSPADISYSWIHYLNKPAINLSRSGDTSETMVERFEHDVLPFSPKYLLIMGGTNSIRAGVSAEDVVNDLKELKAKCLAHNIEPIFLTLLPINPDNIEKCFQQPTNPGWLQEMTKVNEFIRSQHNVDVARAMPFGSAVLPTNMGIDGLHTNADAKKLIAATINADWDNVLHASKQQDRNLLAQLF